MRLKIEPATNDPINTVLIRIDGQNVFVERAELLTLAESLESYSRTGFIN